MTYAEGAGVWGLIAVCLIVLMFISSSLNKIVLITLCLFSIIKNVTKQFPITFSGHNPAPQSVWTVHPALLQTPMTLGIEWGQYQCLCPGCFNSKQYEHLTAVFEESTNSEEMSSFSAEK